MEKNNSYPTLFGCQTGGAGRIVVAGVPYDRGTDSARGGCAEAPIVLRTYSQSLAIREGALYDCGLEGALVQGTMLSDIGNLRFRSHERDDAYLDLISE